MTEWLMGRAPALPISNQNRWVFLVTSGKRVKNSRVI